MTCEQARISLGVYVVGALDDAERAAVRAHLETCRGCRDELAELAGVPRLLARVTLAEAVHGPAQPDDDLLPRLLTRMAAERARHRRQRLVLASAAAVVVLALVASLVGVLAGRGTSDSPASPPVAAASTTPTWSASDATTGVWASVSVTPVAWGSRVHLDLGGVAGGSRCQLVAVSRAGDREVAATWVVPPGGYAKGGPGLLVDGGVSLPGGELARFEVVTLDGQLLVTVPV
ncbi:MAG TPA: anti-sigma factor [Actinomycetes bacterium]|nr:anti-sigma factor [Actinomycetes bacterium]